MSPWRLAARRLARNRLAVAGAGVVLVLCLLALLAPALAPADPNFQPDPVHLQSLPPSGGHLLGTDRFSRDVLSRLLYGARVSLPVGLLAALVGVGIGAPVGLVAGYAGGALDEALMRGVDLALAVPRIFLLLVVMALWEDVPLLALAAVIGATGWFEASRVVRASTRQLMAADFVAAACALGAGARRTIASHLLPNVAAPIIVAATLDVGNIILLEAGLSYLGLGVQPPTPTWGNMIREGKDLLTSAPWVSAAPGAALVLTVVAFNLVGDAVRDALDPRTA